MKSHCGHNNHKENFEDTLLVWVLGPEERTSLNKGGQICSVVVVDSVEFKSPDPVLILLAEKGPREDSHSLSGIVKGGS